jgi:Fic family protein
MSKIIQKLAALKQKIDKLRPFSETQEKAIQERLRIEWTYNSNALEGNTLTFGETLFFLREGLTSEGKPLKDYLETKNHAEAIEGLEEIIQSKRPLTESAIKELHAVLMKGMEFSVAKGGHGQLIQKQIHPGMEKLLKWYHKAKELDPVTKAAIFHYRFVAIHPFDDGNGRMARLLMNLILIKAKYPPCIVKTIHRKNYLKALEEVDLKKTFEPFIEFIGLELLDTLAMTLSVLQGKEKAIPETKTLNWAEREHMIFATLGKEELSIGQIHEKLPQIPRPTLKVDLKHLVKTKRLKRTGRKKGVLYSQND